MKRLSRQMVPYLVVFWVVFLTLSGMTPCCDARAAAAPRSHVGESESGHLGSDLRSQGSTTHHLGAVAAQPDHDLPHHANCCQLNNSEYDMAKAGTLTGILRIPAPVFLLATVDAGLLPRQAIESLLARPTVHPPPLKQPLYIRIERFLI